MKREEAHQVVHELVAEDFRVKKLLFMGGSKATDHIIYGSLGVHTVHIPTKFSKGWTL